MRLSARAPAKLNLTLEVLGKRADGYHEIRSIVQPVSLFDELQVEPDDDVVLSAPGLDIPLERNLAYQAALALQRSYGVQRGALLQLTKVIPVGSGLGGGSSDAAAALRLLSRLWDIRPQPQALMALASSLGSDVPLFLASGAVSLRGRGELVEPLTSTIVHSLVVIWPQWTSPDKTRAVYQGLGENRRSDGAATRRLAQVLKRRGFPGPDLLKNDLLPSAEVVFPGLAPLREELAGRAGRPFFLSGAGPALFSLATSAADARQCAEAASGLGHPTFVTKPLRRRPAVVELA